MSTYCIRSGFGSGSPFCFLGGSGFGTGILTTSVHELINALPSFRQIRAWAINLTCVLSVFFLGSVQSSCTRLPLRTPVKSSTGRASCSDGNWGAPGIPHPAHDAIKAMLPASQAKRSLMETYRVTNRQGTLRYRFQTKY